MFQIDPGGPVPVQANVAAGVLTAMVRSGLPGMLVSMVKLARSLA